MKRKLANHKRELYLISVLVNDINENKNPEIIYHAIKEIVPQIAIDLVEALTRKILKVIPPEALNYYYNEGASLISIIVVYNNSGEYSIVVETSPAIQEYFKKEIDEIAAIMDNVIINF
jgi:hypothetical protein